jgi:hypothetical protein
MAKNSPSFHGSKSGYEEEFDAPTQVYPHTAVSEAQGAGVGEITTQAYDVPTQARDTQEGSKAILSGGSTTQPYDAPTQSVNTQAFGEMKVV